MSLELTSSFDTSLLAFLYKSCCSYAVFLKHNFQKKTLKMVSKHGQPQPHTHSKA